MRSSNRADPEGPIDRQEVARPVGQDIARPGARVKLGPGGPKAPKVPDFSNLPHLKQPSRPAGIGILMLKLEIYYFTL